MHLSSCSSDPIIISGPPNTGKLERLSREIDTTLRLTPNPYGLIITSSTESSASLLSNKVQKLSGKRRSSFYRFHSFRELAFQLASQTAGISPASEHELRDLADKVVQRCGYETPFLPPLEQLECCLPSDKSVIIFRKALQALQKCHPYDVMIHHQTLHILDYIFVADLHLIPPFFIDWLSRYVDSGAKLVATYDPFHPRAHGQSLPWSFTNISGQPPQISPLSYSVFDNINDEVDALIDSVNSTDPPDALILAHRSVENRFLIRSSLQRASVLSARSDSVYCSTELRWLCTAIEASVYDRPESIELLFTLIGIDLRTIHRVTGGEKHPSVYSLLNDPELTTNLYSPKVVALREALEQWKLPQFPCDLVDTIGSFLCRYRSLDPLIYQTIASEISKSDMLIQDVYTRFTENLRDAREFDDVPHVIAVPDLQGRRFGQLLVSTSNRSGDLGLDEFIYTAAANCDHLSLTRTDNLQG